MEDIIELHPAKRILALYFLSFVLVLAALIYGVEHLNQAIDLNQNITSVIWKVAVIIGVSLLAYSFLWRLTSLYTISAECVASTVGILSKSYIHIPMNRIIDYQIFTPLLERILGLGSIQIGTAGDEDLIMRQISIEEIEVAAKRLDKLLNKEQRRSDNDTNLAA